MRELTWSVLRSTREICFLYLFHPLIGVDRGLGENWRQLFVWFKTNRSYVWPWSLISLWSGTVLWLPRDEGPWRTRTVEGSELVYVTCNGKNRRFCLFTTQESPFTWSGVECRGSSPDPTLFVHWSRVLNSSVLVRLQLRREHLGTFSHGGI